MYACMYLHMHIDVMTKISNINLIPEELAIKIIAKIIHLHDIIFHTIS